MEQIGSNIEGEHTGDRFGRDIGRWNNIEGYLNDGNS